MPRSKRGLAMEAQNVQRRYAAAVCFKQALGANGGKLSIQQFFEAVYGHPFSLMVATAAGRSKVCRELAEWLGISPHTARSYFRVNRETGEITETLPVYHGRALLVAYRGLQCFAATQSGVTQIAEWLGKRSA